MEVEEEEVAYVFLNSSVKTAKEVKERDDPAQERQCHWGCCCIGQPTRTTCSSAAEFQTSTKELEEEMTRLTERIPRTHSGLPALRHQHLLHHQHSSLKWLHGQFRISVKKTNCQTPTWFIKSKLDLKRITAKLKLLKSSSEPKAQA